MKLYNLVHRFNYRFPLPRGRWRLMRLAEKYSPLPPQVNNVSVGHGLRMDLDPRVYPEKVIYFNVKEPEVTQSIFRFVNEGDTVIDVGANIGYFSMLLGLRVGKQGRVHAFEPNPALHERLFSHAVRNNLQDVIVIHPLAIADVPGSTDLYLYGRNHGASSIHVYPGRPHTSVKVKVETLDGLLARGEIELPTFIKIDVEGAELLVLRGGGKLIGQARPVIVAEVSEHQRDVFGYSAQAIWTWAADHDYAFGFLHWSKGYTSVSREAAASLPKGNVLLKPK